MEQWRGHHWYWRLWWAFLDWLDEVRYTLGLILVCSWRGHRWVEKMYTRICYTCGRDQPTGRQIQFPWKGPDGDE